MCLMILMLRLLWVTSVSFLLQGCLLFTMGFHSELGSGERGLVGTKQIRQAKNLGTDEWNSVAAQLSSFSAELEHDENARRAEPLAGDGGGGGGQGPIPISDAPPEMDMDEMSPSKARLCSLSFVLGCLLGRLLSFLRASVVSYGAQCISMCFLCFHSKRLCGVCMCLLLSCVIWPSPPYLLFQFQVHWDNVTEILAIMEKVGKESNKCYENILGTSDMSGGPSECKTQLMTQMEDNITMFEHLLHWLSTAQRFGKVDGEAATRKTLKVTS